jgi:general secretion pathway protein G
MTMERTERNPHLALIRRRREAGVTLIEILIVVAIMAMIAGGVAVFAVPKFRESQVKAAETSARALRQAVQMWQTQNNEVSCPTVEQLVKEKHLDSAANVQDPWGEDFKLSCPAGDVVVASPGPDKKSGTEDDVKVPKGASESE